MTDLMGLFAKIFYVGSWDHDIGGRQIENRIRKGDPIPDNHLRAWRISREEVAVNVMRWVGLVIENYNAVQGNFVAKDRLLLEEFSDSLWGNIRRFLENLSLLPCWTNRELSLTVFGPKQNVGYWESVFKTGKSPAPVNLPVIPLGLNLQEMIAQE